MFTNGAEYMMNQDSIGAVVIAVTLVVSVIISFTIYFNDISLDQAWAVQQQEDKGLVVGGGVHSPEFQIKKNNDTVKNAVSSGNNSWYGKKS